MEGSVTLFHEEQRFWSAWFWVVIVMFDVPFVILAVFFHEIGLLFGAMLISAIAALFALARLVVDVTRDEITIAFHLLWPTRRIKIADVRRAHATTYNTLLEYGGFGVRLSPRGWAFNTGGDHGVLVETNDGTRVMIGSRRADELAAAIATAVTSRAG